MVENKVSSFTSKMNDLLMMEREAEMEETANVLAEYSFRVSQSCPFLFSKLPIKHLFDQRQS